MSDTTMADVADKTVDHIANGVAQIAAAVEKLAPGAWEVAVRQQRAVGAVDLLIGLFLLVGATIALRHLWPLISKADDSLDRGFGWFFTATGFATIASIAVICFVRDGLLHSLNPEFYAAKDIAAMVRK